jgi:hypothetical protein
VELVIIVTIVISFVLKGWFLLILCIGSERLTWSTAKGVEPVQRFAPEMEYG